jgi:hypothetical protein
MWEEDTDIAVEERSEVGEFSEGLIRVFKSKNSYWKLEERRFETVWDDGWRVTLPPLNHPGRDMEYRIVRIKPWKRRAPGTRDWNRIAHGKPRRAWNVVYQRQGGPAATGSAPRPDGAPRCRLTVPKLEVLGEEER